MNNFDAFAEYRESSVPYQPEQRHGMLQSSQTGKFSPQEVQGQRPRPYPRLQPTSQTQQRPVPTRMPKAQALALLQKMKRGIVVAAFLIFCTFVALVFGHPIGTAATAQKTTASTTTVHKTTTTAAPKTTTTTAAPKTTTATTPKATSTTQQGYGFGSSTATSTPVSGTHTS